MTKTIQQKIKEKLVIKALPFFKVIFFNLLLTLIFLEVSLMILTESGIIDIRKPPYSMQYSNQSFWGDINEHFGVWHIPNSKFRHIRNCYDIVYSSNSYGARDIERSLYSKAPRVIVLGDSFMEGMGVERGERLSEILEKKSGIEHLNFGTSGHFGPVHEYLLYKHLAKKFNHEIIILGILPDNDFDDMDSQKRKDRYFPYFEGKYPDYQLKYSIRSLDKSSWKLGNPKDDRPLKHFLLNYTYTRNLYDYIGALLDNWSLGRNIRQGSYQKISSFVEYDSEKWDMMKYSYEKIIEEAACKKILFFTIPRMKDIWWYKENRTSPLGEKLKTWASQFPNVYFLDLLPLMSEVVPSHNWAELFNGCDRHWTKKGHKIAAELIMEKYGSSLY